ncbi:hypothetical protein [Congregicoccus parvus]|uniref:hypothetical protein n=1 Tax=Congregicoccus parvus TaxID=3081749 RepID=UPI003FA547F6
MSLLQRGIAVLFATSLLLGVGFWWHSTRQSEVNPVVEPPPVGPRTTVSSSDPIPSVTSPLEPLRGLQTSSTNEGERVAPRIEDRLWDPEFRESYRDYKSKLPPPPILTPEEIEQLGIPADAAAAVVEYGHAARATVMARFSAHADIAAPAPNRRVVEVTLPPDQSRALKDGFYEGLRKWVSAEALEAPANREILNHMEGRMYSFGEWPLVFSLTALGSHRIDDAVGIGHVTFLNHVAHVNGKSDVVGIELAGNWDVYWFRHVFGELADRVLAPGSG